jgi:hypothetical protein
VQVHEWFACACAFFVGETIELTLGLHSQMGDENDAETVRAQSRQERSPEGM